MLSINFSVIHSFLLYSCIPPCVPPYIHMSLCTSFLVSFLSSAYSYILCFPICIVSPYFLIFVLILFIFSLFSFFVPSLLLSFFYCIHPTFLCIIPYVLPLFSLELFLHAFHLSHCSFLIISIPPICVLCLFFLSFFHPCIFQAFVLFVIFLFSFLSCFLPSFFLFLSFQVPVLNPGHNQSIWVKFLLHCQKTIKN